MNQISKLGLRFLAVSITLIIYQATAAITNGLVGHWTFDETNGVSLADSTSYANFGALSSDFPTNSAQWVPGQIAGSLDFRGPGIVDSNDVPLYDYVIVTNYPKPTTNMSIAIWAYCSQIQTHWRFIMADWSGAAGQFHLATEGGPNRLVCYSANAAGAVQNTLDSVAFPVGTWQHVAFVADGSMMRLYRNGVQVSAVAYDGTIYQPPVESFGIGCKPADDGSGPGSAAYLWQGRLDDLGIWSRGLTPAEVAGIYSAGLAGKDLTKADESIVNPPTIVPQPQGQSLFVGDTMKLSADAQGTLPISFQWRKDQQDLAGKTNKVLRLASITTNDAGIYALVVSNAGGSVTSSPAVVTVEVPLGITNGLVGYWAFNETSGLSLADSTTNGNVGVLSSGFPADSSQWVPGKIGGSLHYRGPSDPNYDNVRVPNYPKPTSTMTLSIWALSETANDWRFILADWNGGGLFHFAVEGGVNLGIFSQAGDLAAVHVTDSAAFPLNAWQHLAYVADGSMMRLYRNGIEVGAKPYDGTLVAPAIQSFGIGCYPGATTNGPGVSSAYLWQGNLDDLGIWKRGLTPEEVLDIYQAGLDGKPLTQADEYKGVIPLSFLTSPESQILVVGEDLKLSASISGSYPRSIQWFKGTQALAGETNSALTKLNVTTNDAGSFFVVASNSVGSVTSAPALVTISEVVDINSGLIGHWTFNETNGLLAADATAYGNPVVLNNFPVDDSQWVAGKIGGAVHFRGPALSLDYGAITNYPKPAKFMSFSIWGYSDQTPTDWRFLIADWGPQGGEIHLGLQGGVNLFNAMIQGNGAQVNIIATNVFPVGSWEHVAVVYDGTMARIYYNGNQVAAAPYNGTILQPNIPLGVGTRDGGNASPQWNWHGSLDDMAIWRRGLTGAEVMAIYQAGLQGKDITQVVVPPTITIVRSGSDVILSWPNGGTLQQSTNAAGPYLDIPGSSPVVVTPSEAKAFYRVRVQ